MATALTDCTDPTLAAAIHLSFACTLREGEVVGLQWERVDVGDEAFRNNTCSLYIDRELKRVDLKVLEKLGNDDILFSFPVMDTNSTSQLVLKTPKTESSVRRVFIPKSCAAVLREVKKDQELKKQLLRSLYADYDLVICFDNGRPIEQSVISRKFKRFVRQAELPPVVFHSLRKSSATYKLKYNRDIKSTQNDGGWADSKMLMDVYAQIESDGVQMNAVSFEENFYDKLHQQKPVERPVQIDEPDVDLNKLVNLLQKSPEAMQLLQALAKC